MQSIVIRIDPNPLVNADLDLRYEIPDRLAVASSGSIRDSGYGFEPETDAMHIYLSVNDAEKALAVIVGLLESQSLGEPNLLEATQVGLSSQSVTESSRYRIASPPQCSGTIHAVG